jgi:hypothetical protein
MLSSYLKAKDYLLALRAGRDYMARVFRPIHSNNLWGNDESVSGRGSTVAITAGVRHELPRLLERLGVGTMLDAPCGDFNWMKHVELGGVHYIGADIVPELIESDDLLYGSLNRSFIVADITRDGLPKADLILCRECFVHLSYRFIRAALANFQKSGAGYLLTTTYPGETNHDILTGQWRPLNLEASPFNFPSPLEVIEETDGRVLGLWQTTY